MEILNKIIEIIAQTLGKNKEEIKLETTFESLGCDDLDNVEIIMEVENIFNIKIADEDAESLKTVNDLVSYVEKKLHPEPESGEDKK
jgi:acyl carrier protein